ncbi:Voltage-dependent T-type calcium channel subunit alpha-1G [Liparis tanakae]|uniref:Voltage-dependent T-type calcium channel subunit alpha-1G n=1 Tax=Liparis tanakae TaxID=230148 RepID=A0A4Z2FZV5_9TELE|nr:Voltage-dependent T-type calcium channel subunit alpha-1G [Liparis tanakae]
MNITNKSDCLLNKNKWERHKYNFDNLGQALMSLFVLASKDGWVDIMYNGLDAVGVDQQPSKNHNPWMLLYFISFLLIVAFFVLNMFVGVVVENFHKCRRHQEAAEAKRREEKRLKRMEKKRRSKEKELADVVLGTALRSMPTLPHPPRSIHRPRHCTVTTTPTKHHHKETPVLWPLDFPSRLNSSTLQPERALAGQTVSSCPLEMLTLRTTCRETGGNDFLFICD